MKKKTVFISHSSQDAAMASRISAILEKSGVPCWIAPRDIRPGFEYDEEILIAIEQTNALVVLISEHSNKSGFVKKELERAVHYGKEIYPVRIQDVKPSRNLEFFVSTAHWTDAFKKPSDGDILTLAGIIKQRKTSRSPRDEIPVNRDPNDGFRYVKSVFREELPSDVVVYARTTGSTYKFSLFGKDVYFVSGGWFDKNGPSPFKTTIAGCLSKNETEPHPDYLAAQGLSIVFGNGVVTTPVINIRMKKKT